MILVLVTPHSEPIEPIEAVEPHPVHVASCAGMIVLLQSITALQPGMYVLDGVIMIVVLVVVLVVILVMLDVLPPTKRSATAPRPINL